MTRRPPKDKLTIYRRHAGKCSVTSKALDQCECVIWCHGQIGGKIIRQSLDTRSLAIADMRRKDLLAGPGDPDGKKKKIPVGGELTIEAAEEIFNTAKKSTTGGTTQMLYKRAVAHFRLFCESRSITLMRQIEPAAFVKYFEANAKWSPRTKITKLTHLRVFFAYCASMKMIDESPAASESLDFATPTDQPREPFTHAEIAKIFATLDAIEVRDHRRPQYRAHRIGIVGRTTRRFRPQTFDYERVRALILVMLYSGMRVSDAVWLERSSLREDGMLDFRMIKTRSRIKMPIRLHPVAIAALQALPASRTYFFVQDREGDYQEARQALRRGQDFQAHLTKGLHRHEMNGAMRLVKKVLRTAGLTGNCHRFRDTFAVNMLIGGADIFAVSQMLGHSDVKITQKHYLNLANAQYRESMSDKTSVLNFPLPASLQPQAVPA